MVKKSTEDRNRVNDARVRYWAFPPISLEKAHRATWNKKTWLVTVEAGPRTGTRPWMDSLHCPWIRESVKELRNYWPLYGGGRKSSNLKGILAPIANGVQLTLAELRELTRWEMLASIRLVDYSLCQTRGWWAMRGFRHGLLVSQSCARQCLPGPTRWYT